MQVIVDGERFEFEAREQSSFAELIGEIHKELELDGAVDQYRLEVVTEGRLDSLVFRLIQRDPGRREESGGNVSPSGRSEFGALRSELDAIAMLAEGLRPKTLTPALRREVSDSYFSWYGKALQALPDHFKDRFRDAFEGGKVVPRIKAFLADPVKPNVLFVPGRPVPGVDQYLHTYEGTFLPSAETQRQILFEAEHDAGRQERAVIDTAGDIFVVHGHGELELQTVARFLERVTDRKVVILREQPSRGRTIIEKFEGHALKCAFAVVLLTADDEGGSRVEGSRSPRARQNVVLEAGYFLGMLGRDRVVLLHEKGVELPSDLSGLVYVSLADGWKLQLAQELEAADIAVDRGKIT